VNLTVILITILWLIFQQFKRIAYYCLIIGWLSGKEALYMESLTEEQIGQDIVEALKKFLNKKDIPQPRKIIRYM
jgi:hypothetical protein